MAIRPEFRNVVCTAFSLDEVKAIESRANDSRHLVLRALVSLWGVWANTLLGSAKLALFGMGPTAQAPRRVVAYSTGTLGDTVAILPALASIRRSFPKSEIISIVNCDHYSPIFAEALLGQASFVDRVITLPDHPVQRRGMRLTMDIPKDLPRGSDLFVNLSPFGNRGWLGAVLRELILAKAIGAKRVAGFGVRGYNRGAFLRPLRHYFVQNEPLRIYSCIKALGPPLPGADDLLPRAEGAKSAAKEKLERAGLPAGATYAVLNPGAKFLVKCWPPERFAEVARALQRQMGMACVVVGTKEEAPLADQVARQSGGTALSIAGDTSIPELVAVLRGARACVTNDTGTMHLAAMAGVPTVGIFTTRMSPALWFPYGRRVAAVFAFNDKSYSYSDSGDSEESLLAICTDHVLAALDRIMVPDLKTDKESNGLTRRG